MNKVSMKTQTRNHPIATVIKNYINKKSGKVSVSREEIQRRFFGLDWKDQKKIMAAFLESGQTDRDWAYACLLDLWDSSFETKVQELWEAYHEHKCAWVIIRHFPEAFIKEHINTFNEDRDYYFICRRLAADPDFVIDKDRLSKTDYLMALSHGNRHIDDDEARDVLYSIVQDLCFHWCVSLELSSHFVPRRNEILVASDFTNMSIALYYLEKMGHDRVVSEFRRWQNTVQTSVRNSEEYKSLVTAPCSDYEYKEKLASIVQQQLYYALPAQYKTMTDREYLDQWKADRSEYWVASPISQQDWSEDWPETLAPPF